MPHAYWIYNDETYTVEEAEEIAREEGCFASFPLAALRAMREGPEQDGLWFRPSNATRCLRQRALKQHHNYALNIENRWAAGVGHAIHLWLANQEAGLHELTLEAELEVVAPTTGELIKVPFRGTIDVLDPERSRIIDYKTVSEFRKKNMETGRWETRKLPDDEHELQVNLYHLLAELNGYDIDSAGIWYVRTVKEATRRYVEIDLWDIEDTYNLAVDMCKPIADVISTGTLPPAFTEDDPNYWMCRYCPVKTYCEELSKNEQDRNHLPGVRSARRGQRAI
jgi:CRISPR/Cas system-associated exonuclease Cas4 (RecB family)